MGKYSTICIHAGNTNSGHIINHFHLCSEGLKTDVLFHNQNEFVDGMNCIAIAKSKISVSILAFCIMDNHFHFILTGTSENIKAFAAKINQCYGIKQKSWSNVNAIPHKIKWEAFPIDNEKYLANSIAYVMNNPFKAGYDKWILDYPWSSNSLYFRDELQCEQQKNGFRRLDELSTREMASCIRSYDAMPGDWLLTPLNYIWPGSYVDWEVVENIFRNIQQMKYFLVSKKENEETELSLYRYRVCISDQELREKTLDLSESMFRVVEIRNLKMDDRIRLAQRVIQKTGCRRAQIYRILHLQEK